MYKTHNCGELRASDAGKSVLAPYVEASGYEYCYSRDLAGQYFRSAWAASRESDGTYHLAIANAIQEGDYQTAEQMLRKDVLAVKNEILTVNRL